MALVQDVKYGTNCQGIFKGDDYQYIGEWQNAKQHGNGIEVWKDGRKFIGEFKNGRPWNLESFNENGERQSLSFNAGNITGHK